MNIAIDSNVLLYAEGIDDIARQTLARDTLTRLSQHELLIPLQALGELFAVLVRKDRRLPSEAHTLVRDWLDNFNSLPTTDSTLRTAMEIAASHRLRIWDAVILAAASHAGCRLLLSEDLHDGFTWGGVTIANPFAPVRHPLLEAALATTGNNP